MPNYSICSNGERVTQSTIDTRLSKSYRDDDGTTYCRGCGKQATCHAHIVAKARCKVLHLTELIWSKFNYFKACYTCNQTVENVSSAAFRSLLNHKYCLSVLEKYDQERYQKATLFAN